MKQYITICVAMALIATMGIVAAEDAPSMWMEKTSGGIDLMVNTSNASSGANAWVHFDPVCINITNADFTGSPWQPMTQPGWSHQGDHIILALTNFSGVDPGEYQIAKFNVTCVGSDCTSPVKITHAEPLGVITYNATYSCSDPVVDEARISIGDGVGTVTIPILIYDADNVGAIDLTLSYNPKIANITGVSGGDMDHTYTNLNHTAGWIRVGAFQAENPGLSGQVTLLEVNFGPGTVYSECALELNITTFEDATPECNPMPHSTSGGKYISLLNGDVNDDGEVNMQDAIYIAKYTIGIPGFETINEEAADVNGNGVIGLGDAMYLAKHVLGVPGFEELK